MQGSTPSGAPLGSSSIVPVVGVGSGGVGCHAAVSCSSSGLVSAVAAAAQEGPKVSSIACACCRGVVCGREKKESARCQAFQVTACGSWVRSGWISGGNGWLDCAECCRWQSAVSAAVTWTARCRQPGPKSWLMAAV